ncbi:MAG: hypothetical protein KJ000_35770 [Pirellulaceae bacterium]|nr:hypothetical protein [Pirellulaceae bacterium]
MTNQEEIRRVVATTRIIVLALATGVFIFGVVVMTLQAPDPQAPLNLLTIMAVAFGGGAIVMRLVLPSVFTAAQVRQIGEQSGAASGDDQAGDDANRRDASKLAMAFQTKTIFACALLEGAAFFALVALMIEHHVASLIVAAALLAGILLSFPTLAATEDWIEQQQRRIDEHRALTRR